MDPNNTTQFSQQDVEANKLMGILSYLPLLFLVPIFAAKDSPYAKFHANQGLILFLGGCITNAVTFVLQRLPFMGFFGWIFSTVVGILWLVLAIIGIINALNGEAKQLPVIGGFTVLK